MTRTSTRPGVGAIAAGMLVIGVAMAFAGRGGHELPVESMGDSAGSPGMYCPHDADPLSICTPMVVVNTSGSDLGVRCTLEGPSARYSFNSDAQVVYFWMGASTSASFTLVIGSDDARADAFRLSVPRCFTT